MHVKYAPHVSQRQRILPNLIGLRWLIDESKLNWDVKQPARPFSNFISSNCFKKCSYNQQTCDK